MEWGREYWDIFLIAVAGVIVFGVIQACTWLREHPWLTEHHRAARWISDLLSRATPAAFLAGVDEVIE